ncbi:MAG: PIN domain-containing protein [Jiangellaceae bacterium]
MALTGYLFDTSVLHRLSNEVVADAVDRHGLDRVLYRCAVVDLEVLRSSTSKQHYQQLRDLLDGGFADLPITPEVIDIALATQRKLVEVGKLRGVSIPDLIIAACAEAHNATVVHYDGDYDRITEVTGQATEWVVPSGSVD